MFFFFFFNVFFFPVFFSMVGDFVYYINTTKRPI